MPQAQGKPFLVQEMTAVQGGLFEKLLVLTSSKNRAKSETPSMALTTQRLQDMSVSAPVRGDGTKTPLRIPPTEIQKHRKTSSHSERSGTSEEEMEEEEDEMPATFEDMGHMIQQVKKKMRQHWQIKCTN